MTSIWDRPRTLPVVLDFSENTSLETELRDHIAALRDQLQDQKDYYAKVINEPCPNDEIHCACVPALRARISELESQLAAERDALLSSASDVVGMDVRIKELEAELLWFTDSGNYPDRPDIDYGYQTSRARRALERKP